MHVRNRRDDCLVPSVERAIMQGRAGPECRLRDDVVGALPDWLNYQENMVLRALQCDACACKTFNVRILEEQM
jgi:hypothetical protein